MTGCGYLLFCKHQQTIDNDSYQYRRRRKHLLIKLLLFAHFVLSLVHTSNNVEATFDFVERIVRLVAFDNAASTLLLVWTGFTADSEKIEIHKVHKIHSNATSVKYRNPIHPQTTKSTLAVNEPASLGPIVLLLI